MQGGCGAGVERCWAWVQRCRGAEVQRRGEIGPLAPRYLQMRTSESSMLAATDSPASPWVHLCRIPLASR